MNAAELLGRLPRWQVSLSLVLLALLIAGTKEPLAGMHWDVPIYLYQAKRFAETHYLANYVRHAAEIAAQVHGQLPSDEWYSEAYWRFVRLGNTAILGWLVSLFGSTLAAIQAATWLYEVSLIAGLALCAAVVMLVARHRTEGSSWFAGAAFSLLLFLVSDIYRYLAGNLISEVLAIGLLGASFVAILEAIRRGSLTLAAISGALAFVSYTVRVESVWTWLMFLIAYLATLSGDGKAARPWKPVVVAAGTALCLYLLYAVVFHPLADPRLYLTFVASLSKEKQGVPGYQLLFVAGGLLWIGALVSLPRIRSDPLTRFAWLWLLLAALPWLPLLVLGGPCQTRMMTLLIPPLILASSLGWASLLRRGVPRSMAVVVVLFALFSMPPVYAWLHGLPGFWRIQVLRPYLYVPKYERIDYLPGEMAALSKLVYGPGIASILYAPRRATTQEHLDMIRFFGDAYAPEADLALSGDPGNRKPCDRLDPTPTERVVICSVFTDPAAVAVQRARYRLLMLRKSTDPAMAGTVPLGRTTHYAIDQFR